VTAVGAAITNQANFGGKTREQRQTPEEFKHAGSFGEGVRSGCFSARQVLSVVGKPPEHTPGGQQGMAYLPGGSRRHRGPLLHHLQLRCVRGAARENLPRATS